MPDGSGEQVMQQGICQPRPESADGPIPITDQPRIEHRVAEQAGDIGRFRGGHAFPECAKSTKPVDDHAGAVQPLACGRLEQRPGGRIDACGDFERSVQRRDPAVDLDQDLGPAAQQLDWILQHEQPKDFGAFPNRDRHIVAGDRPVERQFQRLELATDGSEHRLSADSCALGDGIDRGGAIPLADEKLSRRGHDPSPGLLRLLGAQLRAVVTLDNIRQFRHSRDTHYTECYLNWSAMRTAIIGAGPTGLFTALALGRRGGRIVVIDRDPGPRPAGGWDRKGVMQFHHAHTFRGPVVDALRDELPDVLEAMEAAGARIATVRGTAVAMLCRRSVFERVLRERAAAEPGVELVTGHVDRVRAERGRACGVDVEGRKLSAGLVIDASGRASRVLRTVRGGGEGAVCGASYVTRQYRLRDGATPGPTNSPIGLSLSYPGYFATVFLHDNQAFSITITHDGTDPRVRRLRFTPVFEKVLCAIPALADWINPQQSEPISPVLPGGQLYNSYRGQLDDAGEPVLPGLISVGDSVCTTTPLAGRGVALAYRQAAKLVRLLTDCSGDIPSATIAFDRWCTATIRPWFDDHVASDADRMRRWAGGAVDLHRPLPSDLVVAAAEADPALAARVEPFNTMAALPASLEPARETARAIYARGWRPAVPDGPTRDELGEICASSGTTENWEAIGSDRRPCSAVS